MTRRYYALLVALLFSLGCTPSNVPTTMQEDGVLAGTVSDTDGQALPGVFVSAHRAGVTTTVLTDATGRYRMPGFDTLGYRIEAYRAGFDTARTERYDTRTGGPLDFVLRRRAETYDQAPSAFFLNQLPDGTTKRQFILDCTGCHQFDQQTIGENGRLKSRATWQARTEQMISFVGAHTAFPILAPSRDAETTAAWLAEHLGGPEDPLPVFEPPPASGEASTIRITEYYLPEPGDLPHDLMPLADGRVLITGMMTHQMYLLDPDTGTFETVPIPVSAANPRALTVDAGGAWWVLLGFPKKIAGYDPATEAWTSFDIGMYPHSIALADDGRLWFNGHFTKEPELIGVLDPRYGEVTTFEVPTPTMPDGGSTIPYGLRIAPDGTIWATQLVGGRLLRFDPDTEAFTLYPLPEPYSGPRRLDISPDGTVWIPEYAAGRLAHFDPEKETFEEFDLPVKDALPYIVRVHPETGHIWIATSAADAVLRFDPASQSFAVYPLPTHRALVRHMEIDPATGAVWIAYSNSPAVAPKIARLEVL